MKFGLRIRYTDVICDGTLKNTYVNGVVTGYAFDIRLCYYRGHFLSDIEEMEITVDGEKLDARDITFCLNGKEFARNQLGELYSEFWRITVPAHIEVRKPGGLKAGGHKIELDMWLRIPYLPLPGGPNDHTYMPLDNCETKELELVEA